MPPTDETPGAKRERPTLTPEFPIEQQLPAVREAAHMTVELLGKHADFELGYDVRSIEWISGFIERQRSNPGFSDNPPPGLVSCLGSYLGECIAKATRGRWQWNDGMLGVMIESPMKKQSYVFPLTKVEKQFRNGVEGGDSILGMYNAAMAIANGSFDNPTRVDPKTGQRLR